MPSLSHNAAMRDGFWKLVVPGDVSANSFDGWRDDLHAGRGMRKGEFNVDRAPDAVGYPAWLDEPQGKPMLFNLSFDPLEKTDCADLHPERVSKMMCELEDWFEDVERDRSRIPDRQHRTAVGMRAVRKGHGT